VRRFNYLNNEVKLLAVEAAGLGVDSGESCYLLGRYSWHKIIDAI
jgi:tryptophan synthase beta subunit